MGSALLLDAARRRTASRRIWPAASTAAPVRSAAGAGARITGPPRRSSSRRHSHASRANRADQWRNDGAATENNGDQRCSDAAFADGHLIFSRVTPDHSPCQGNGPNLTQPKPLYYALHLVFYYRVFFHSSTVQIDYVRSRRFFLPSLGHLIFYAPIRTNNLSQHRQTEVETSPTFLLTCRLSKCISSCFIGLYCAQQ